MKVRGDEETQQPRNALQSCVAGRPAAQHMTYHIIIIIIIIITHLHESRASKR